MNIALPGGYKALKLAASMDEKKRLATLHGLHILDTLPEERFGSRSRLIQRILDAPIAFASLVGGDRQWFKSCQGLDATETQRDISFCEHTVLGNEALAIPDATLDSRFADKTGAPHIRLYQPTRSATNWPMCRSSDYHEN